MWGRAFLCAMTVVCLPACATNVFSYSSPSADHSAPAQTLLVAEEQPVKLVHCERLADQRADDAVMALYVRQGSEAYEAVHQKTYRACVNWENRSPGQ